MPPGEGEASGVLRVPVVGPDSGGALAAASVSQVLGSVHLTARPAGVMCWTPRLPVSPSWGKMTITTGLEFLHKEFYLAR